MFCELVVIDKKVYRKESPPKSKKLQKANVHVNIAIKDFGSIDEIEMTVEVFFNLKLTW